MRGSPVTRDAYDQFRNHSRSLVRDQLIITHTMLLCYDVTMLPADNQHTTLVPDPMYERKEISWLNSQ